MSISGRLTKDSVFKSIASNDLVTFSIASNRVYKDKETTTYMDCEMWGGSKNLSEHLLKGKVVFVSGRLKQDSWEKDGVKHNKILVVVEDIKLA